KLYELGAPVDWQAVHRGSVGRRRPAPTYPFQRQRYWLDLADRAPALPAPASEETASSGSALVYGFYDELTVVAPQDETADAAETEGHLTFGFLPEPV